ncbi:MAG: gliding motility-associated C-terminal domain-containing protein, partial [Flavobacteriaceae bacterium]|nr:gliding motility-associated C-terminal domain-containing protein [Flavobacteriaceae bacterium]
VLFLFFLFLTTFNTSAQESESGNQNAELGEDLVLCNLNDYEIVPELTGDFTEATYLWSPGGETSPSITVHTSNTYSVKITTSSYALNDSINLLFLTSPNCSIGPICVAVDFEENFGTGTGRVCDLGGATTTYVCNNITQVNDGEYSITNTSNGLNTGWHLDMEDHTEGDVDGRMLFVNADITIGEFYRRTITLSENVDYTFNAWITTVYDTDTGICTGTGIPSNVIFRIEDLGGTLIEETNTGDIENGTDPVWQEFFITFNTGSNTDIQLVLINNLVGGCGNDLAIDDITLSLENSEPQIVTPDDLSECDETGNEEATFNLESQITTILDGQDPTDFNITFHLDQLDAEANQNAITIPTAYVNTVNPETVYVRVERVTEVACFSIINFDLTVELVVDFEVDLPPAVDLCSTDKFPTLDATPTNQGLDLTLVTYEWTDAGGTIVSTEAIFTPTSDGTYSVTINLPPCSFETITIEINTTETPVLDLGTDQVLCDGGIFDIIPELSGNTGRITYSWSTGETTPTITVDTSGTYTLEITVGACVVSDSIEIFISDPIIVEIGDDFKTCPNETQVLTATSNETDVTYQWSLNGGLITGATNQVLEFSIEIGTLSTQIYSVIVNKGECVGEAEIDISLYDIGNCVISQGISPNNDTYNDSLNLEFLSDRAGGISKLQIYSRYGALVFEAVNYIKEWEGQDKNGNELPTGTYFYVVDLVEEDSVYGQQATGWIYLNKDAN